jgi:predicted acylesterase/phospholipase RssA
LFATGYTAAEVKAVLLQKNFVDFLDTHKVMWVPRLLFGKACNSGVKFERWIDERIRAKTVRQGDVRLRDFSSRAILYASSPNKGTYVFDSKDQRRDTVASFAVRCSMSIPFLFTSPSIEGERVYDGGLRHNFPVATFLSANPNTLFIGLFLQAPAAPRKRWLQLLDLYDIWMNQDERDLVDARRDDIVLVDPRPIGMADFNLSDSEKALLLEVGRLGAQEFVVRRKVDSAPAPETVEQLRSRVADLRSEVISSRRRRRARRLRRFVLCFLAMVFIGVAVYCYQVWWGWIRPVL